jgi:hypothetical protein
MMVAAGDTVIAELLSESQEETQLCVRITFCQAIFDAIALNENAEPIDSELGKLINW